MGQETSMYFSQSAAAKEAVNFHRQLTERHVNITAHSLL